MKTLIVTFVTVLLTISVKAQAQTPALPSFKQEDPH